MPKRIAEIFFRGGKAMSLFQLQSDYRPSGDQPEAIRELLEGFRRGKQFQTLLGVTGSGKTFTLANVISRLDSPVLVLSHNKTLAAQLYSEFKAFFPDNAVVEARLRQCKATRTDPSCSGF